MYGSRIKLLVICSLLQSSRGKLEQRPVQKNGEYVDKLDTWTWFEVVPMSSTGFVSRSQVNTETPAVESDVTVPQKFLN